MDITLVCGGREYNDAEVLYTVLNELQPSAIMHGGAPGADTLAGQWAKYCGVPEIIVPANWEVYGRGAGPMRNRWMAALKPKEVIAFPGGRGTADMVKIARKHGIPVTEV